MIEIVEITDEPRQSFLLIGENKERITFNLRYLPTQEIWTFDLSYLNFSVKGLRLAVSNNILYQFRNLLPFGISCISEDDLDPFLINDFSTSRIRLFILTESELSQVETLLSTPVET